MARLPSTSLRSISMAMPLLPPSVLRRHPGIASRIRGGTGLPPTGSGPPEPPQAPLRQGCCFSLPRPTLPLMQTHASPPQRPHNHSTASATTLRFQRSHDRLGVSHPAMFAGAPFIGEGMIHNLSPTGCLIECDRPVLEGGYVTVRLLLPDQVRALVVELAAIRWVRDGYFGIEFLRLPPPDHSRLAMFLAAYRR